jgi:hypothetical protein
LAHLLQLRPYTLRLAQIVGRGASKIWARYILTLTSRTSNVFYKPAILTRMQSIYRFLQAQPPQELRVKRKHSRDHSVDTTLVQPRIGKFFRPLYPVPLLAPARFVPDDVPAAKIRILDAAPMDSPAGHSTPRSTWSPPTALSLPSSPSVGSHSGSLRPPASWIHRLRDPEDVTRLSIQVDDMDVSNDERTPVDLPSLVPFHPFGLPVASLSPAILLPADRVGIG